MKTPEQMYYEWRQMWDESTDENVCAGRPMINPTTDLGMLVFLTGYQAAQQWISVKERLPEEDVGWTTVYGCILSRWAVQPGFYTKDSGVWVSRFVDEDENYQNYVPFESVTYWMPLPKPPEEEYQFTGRDVPIFEKPKGAKMKTPEELAGEYATWLTNKAKAVRDVADSEESALFVGFLEGYKVAKDQVAHADKVMNSSNNSNGWISVKERLPKEDEKVKILINYFLEGTEVREVTKAAFRNGLWSGEGVHITHPLVSHWMPLPTPPEE